MLYVQSTNLRTKVKSEIRNDQLRLGITCLQRPYFAVTFSVFKGISEQRPPANNGYNFWAPSVAVEHRFFCILNFKHPTKNLTNKPS